MDLGTVDNPRPVFQSASFSNERDLTVHGSTQRILRCFRLELRRTGLDRKINELAQAQGVKEKKIENR